jgi:replicative DNA helicase
MSTSDDRIPPHSPEAEQGILGCALLDPQLAPELREEWFYDLRNRRIADAIMAMVAQGHPVNVQTLYHRFKGAGLVEETGGLSYLAGLPDAAPSAGNFDYWRAVLRDKAVQRRVIHTAQQAMTSVFEGRAENITAFLASYERDVLAIGRTLSGNNSDEVDIRRVLEELSTEYDQAAQEGKPPGLQTGFHDLDRLIGGMKPQQLIVVAARPSVGKSSLALNIADNLALGENQAVGFFSLEMSAKELLHRLACSRAAVDPARLNEGKATGKECKRLADVHARLLKAPLHLCEQGGLTLAQLTAQARRMVERHGIKLVIVDYLGLLRSGEKGRSRYEETTLVSNGLKMLAKELQLPVLALAQLNRDTERENRPPRLSDLRDSGAIEQDADLVWLLHRDGDQTGDSQVVSVIVAKQRNGATGSVKLLFRRALTRFESIAHQSAPPVGS